MLAASGDSVAAGSGGRGARAARVVLGDFRGLTRVCHASESASQLRDLGFVMLGIIDLLS